MEITNNKKKLNFIIIVVIQLLFHTALVSQDLFR